MLSLNADGEDPLLHSLATACQLLRGKRTQLHNFPSQTLAILEFAMVFL